MALQWNGREVVFVEFTIREGRPMRKAFAKGDNEEGSYACLVASARYADTGEPVFASVEELEELPFRLQQRVMRLAGDAVLAIKMSDDDDEMAARATNGSGENVPSAERAGPSL